MKKFKVYVTMTTQLSTIVEAENETDALEKAEAIDGGYFVEDDPTGGGWDITHAVPYKAKRGKK